MKQPNNCALKDEFILEDEFVLFCYSQSFNTMAEVFQEAMLLECGNFTWLTKIEKMKLSNREMDN